MQTALDLLQIPWDLWSPVLGPYRTSEVWAVA